MKKRYANAGWLLVSALLMIIPSVAFSEGTDEPIRIVTCLLPLGTEGVFYRQEIMSTGGNGPTAWSLFDGSLPAGLQLEEGLITGTPAVSGTYSFTILADNDGNSDTEFVTIRIVPPATPYAFGWNGYGQLGHGTTEDSEYGPVIAPGGGSLSGIVAVSAGAEHVLAIDSQGGLWAWGNNYADRLGTATAEWHSAVPVRPEGVEGRVFTAVSAGYEHSLALDADGTVWMWGASDSHLPSSPVPACVRMSYEEDAPCLTDIVAIAMGSLHALALDADGTVWAWGNNSRGQLGQADPYMTGSNFPIRVANPDGSGDLQDIVAISAWDDVNLALTREGHVYEWGARWMDEGRIINALPVMVEWGIDAPLSDIAAISAGLDHLLALAQDGSIWAWGNNTRGQLGTGEGSYPNGVPYPVRVLELRNIIAISAGGSQSMAIDAQGNAWHWGVDAWLPYEIDIETGNAAGISSGYEFSFVLESTAPSPITYTVTPSAGEGGMISPATPQTVIEGETTSFTITPDEGYHIESVTGCGGVLSGSTYTTGPITGNCTVTAVFNRSGEVPILLQDQPGGNVMVAHLNPEGLSNGEIIATRVGTQWSIMGSADFNADGSPDILWRNDVTGDIGLWYMDGVEVVSDAYMATASDPDWLIVGLSDMDRNGTPDILWRHNRNGYIVAWYMDGGRLDREVYVNWVFDPDLMIRGFVDFNRDGSPDILWQDRSSGTVTIWYMSEINLTDIETIAGGSREWEIVGAVDLNGDIAVDLLWQHRSTGEVAVSLMNGTTAISEGIIGELDLPWEIVSP